MNQEDILSGERFITGKDRIEIPLDSRRPDTVLVEFKINSNYINDSQHSDTIEWCIHYKDNIFVLIINWHVAGAREIIWAASF